MAAPGNPPTTPADARGTAPRVYEVQDRHLLLRGGALDGRRWVGVIGVGHRVVVGPGPWQPSHVYVVTAEQVRDAAGVLENVAVPASFA